MEKSILRFLVFFIILVLIINMALLALNKISELLFWAIIIIAAIFTYKLLPKLKK
jgi:hypothetical protein